MSVETATLSLVQLDLDARRLAQLGRRRGLPVEARDAGYLVHCMLGELFGDRAPKPFRIVADDERTLTILGHVTTDAQGLKETADRHADPAVHAACDWEGMAVRPVPDDWRPGLQLGFSVRCCPVVRPASRAREGKRRGPEVDAFLARCSQVEEGVSVDREQVYVDWLRRQVEGKGGARLLQTRLQRFSLAPLLRRDHEPKRGSKQPLRPDATMEGALEVTDGAAFGELLRRGVGRHRAFGHGLLLLKRIQ